MECVHVDFAGPLQQYGGIYLFILVDSYSRWPEVLVCKNLSSKTVINCLRHIFSHLGIVDTLVSDNGTSFVSSETNEWLSNIGCKHLTIAPYHPKSNGLAERMVRTCKEYI